MESLTSFALMVLAIGGVADSGASASKSGLLYFTTPGCSWCTVVAPSVSELQSAGYPVYKIDASQQPQVASQYGVNAFPVFVLVVNGKEVERVEGAQSKQKLERMAIVAQKAIQEANSKVHVAADVNADAASYSSNAPSNRRPHQASAADIIAQGANGLERSNLGSASMFPGQDKVAAAAPATKEKEHGWSLFRDRKDEEKTAEVPTARANNDFASSADKALERTPAAHAAVRIRVQDQKGENYGSGAIIDSRYGNTVILTCGHVLRGLSAGSKVEVDVFTDGKPKTYVAKVIDFDLDADVGLIAIPSEQQLPIALVAGTQSLTNVGSEVCSIGCSAGNTPTKENHQITAINKYNGPDNIECNGVPVQGRSGGGLFDKHQQIVGVCIAADPKDQRGLYCGLKPIHEILRKNKLGYLLGESNSSPDGAIAFGTASQAAPPATPSPFENSLANSAREPNMMPSPSTSSPMPQSSATPSWDSMNAAGVSSATPSVAMTNPGSNWTGTANVLPADAANALSNAVGSKLTIIIDSPNGGQPQVVIIPAVSASFLAELQGTEPDNKPLITSMYKENPTPVMNTSAPATGGQMPAAVPATPVNHNWPSFQSQPQGSRSGLPQTSGMIPYNAEVKKERPQQTGYYVRPFVRDRN